LSVPSVVPSISAASFVGMSFFTMVVLVAPQAISSPCGCRSCCELSPLVPACGVVRGAKTLNLWKMIFLMLWLDGAKCGVGAHEAVLVMGASLPD
jgi:hypothetical protein